MVYYPKPNPNLKALDSGPHAPTFISKPKALALNPATP